MWEMEWRHFYDLPMPTEHIHRYQKQWHSRITTKRQTHADITQESQGRHYWKKDILHPSSSFLWLDSLEPFYWLNKNRTLMSILHFYFLSCFYYIGLLIFFFYKSAFISNMLSWISSWVFIWVLLYAVWVFSDVKLNTVNESFLSFWNVV